MDALHTQRGLQLLPALVAFNFKHGQPNASYKWFGWVWVTTSWSSKSLGKLPINLEEST